MRKLFNQVLIIIFLAGILFPAIQPAAPAAGAEEDAPNDTPYTLVASGVTSYTLAAPKVFWYTNVPQCPPGLSPAENSDQTLQEYHETGSARRHLWQPDTHPVRRAAGMQRQPNLLQHRLGWQASCTGSV